MSNTQELFDLAERVVAYGKKLGADEVQGTVSRSSHVTISRRAGKVEEATEASTRGLVIQLLKDDRYASHSTSDLRPSTLERMIQQALRATTFLEPEPERRQAPIALCGRGVSEEQLDQDDPAWAQRTADDRANLALSLEQAVEAANAGTDDVISHTTYVADGTSEVVRVMSNGFADSSKGNWFALGGMMTLQAPDGKRPESGAYYGARFLADLPLVDEVAAEVVRRTRERLGSGPIDSGNYPLLMVNRAAGRLLGVLGGPLSGGALHQKRSCLAGRLGKRIGSELLTIIDDPTIPRGLGSQPWDGDAMRARPRTIVENGVLQQYNLSVYYARKLGMDPTSGGRSNWVIPTGTRSVEEITRSLPKVIAVTSFLGGNSNAATGDFSFGIRGVLLEHGQPTRSLSEMNVSGNITEIFERLVDVGNDPWTWSTTRSPSLLLDDVSFSGT